MNILGWEELQYRKRKQKLGKEKQGRWRNDSHSQYTLCVRRHARCSKLNRIPPNWNKGLKIPQKTHIYKIKWKTLVICELNSGNMARGSMFDELI